MRDGSQSRKKRDHIIFVSSNLHKVEDQKARYVVCSAPQNNLCDLCLTWKQNQIQPKLVTSSLSSERHLKSHWGVHVKLQHDLMSCL